MKKTIFFLTVMLTLQVFSQSNVKRFFKLSCPMKTWVLLHPFRAKKSLKISQEARKISDSIAQTNLLDGDSSGGQVDAFRHAYWMARLHQEIGKRAALSLGKAHEKENYIAYKKNRLEEGVLPDKVSSEMDLYNNIQGVHLIAKKKSIMSKESLILKVITAIKSGKMKMIRKNSNKKFLTCKGTIIASETLKGKWKNNKCLVFSNDTEK